MGLHVEASEHAAWWEDDRVEHVVLKVRPLTPCPVVLRSDTNEACHEDDGVSRVEVWGYTLRR